MNDLRTLAGGYASGARPSDVLAATLSALEDGDPVWIGARTGRRRHGAGTRARAGLASRARGHAALRRAVRGEGQHRRRRRADHRRVPAVRVRAGTLGDRRRTARGGRRDRDRQDESRSVRDRPRRHALALRRPEEPVRRTLYPGRFELRLRRRRGARTGRVRARHRHCRIGARTGRLQRHRRSQADVRDHQCRGRGAGVPFASIACRSSRAVSTTPKRCWTWPPQAPIRAMRSHARARPGPSRSRNASRSPCRRSNSACFAATRKPSAASSRPSRASQRSAERR